MDVKTIRVLSIEDSQGDARLIHVMLAGAHSLGWDMPRFELEYVDRLAEGLARLEAAMAGVEENIDVVLTDLDLPDSQAWDTFATLHARFPHIPIVVLTGREDEALAIDTVRAGAEDYLYKREMSGTLLAHALSYAIERQRTKEALQQAHAELEARVAVRTAELAQTNVQLQAELVAREQMEARLRFQANLMDQICDSIVATDLEGRITYTNEASARVLQSTPEQLIGQSVVEFGEDPERGASQREIIDQTLAHGAWEGQVINYAQDGTERVWESRTWVVEDEHGEPKGMVGVSTDVTERRQGEQRIAYLNSVLRAIRDVNQMITQESNRDRLFQRACETLVETLGFHTAWIALAASPRHVTALYAAGFEGKARSLIARWKHGGLPPCATAALTVSTDSVIVLDVEECRECLLAEGIEGDAFCTYRTALVVALQYRDHIYGVLGLSAPERFAQDTEVHALVAEMAGDLAFALWKLETEAARARVEEALRESERKYRTLFENMAQGVFYQRADEVLADVNPAALAMMGLTRDQFLGKTSRDSQWRVIREDGTALPVEQHASMVALRTGEPVRDFVIGVYNPVREDWVWMNVNAIPQFKAGAVDHVFVTLHDITARRRMEQALRESEARYRAFMEHFPGIAFQGTVDYQPFFQHGALEEITGYRARDFVEGGLTWQDLIYVEDLPIMKESTDRLVTVPHHKETREYRIVRRDGATRWVRETIQNLVDENGDIYAVQGVLYDITPRKQAQIALEESEERLALAVEGTGVGLWDWQVQTGALVLNAMWAEMIGYTLEELAPISIETWTSLCHPEDLQRANERLNRHFAGETEYYKCELRMQHKQGGWVWMLDQGKVFSRDEEGRPIRMAGTHLDITARKEREQALARYAEDLQRSNEELQRFAYTVSHDLKSPLRAVKSYIGLLEEEYEGHLDAEADQFIRFAVDGARRMEQLIDGLLAYARVDTQGGQLQPTDAEVVLMRVLESLYFEIEEQHAEVTYDPLPTVLADATQLAQVFQNLISNALKFQPPERGTQDTSPRVHIAATPLPLPLGEGRGEGKFLGEGVGVEKWRFSVTDNGIGIASEQVALLFNMFQRLHTAEEYEGTGIGLAICKKIVERHRGQIWVESEVGEGSTFYFTLLNGKGADYHGP